MKDRSFKLLLALLCVSIVFIIHSCKKDNSKTSDIAVLPVEVNNAKAWYQTTYPLSAKGAASVTAQSVHTGAGSLDFSQLIKPAWNKANSYVRSGTKVVELPVNDSSSLLASIHTGNAVTAGKQKFSRSSFLILNNNGAYTAYIMMVIADSAYLKNDLIKLNNDTYYKHDADFSGKVVYFTPKGSLVSGWLYNNGKITGKLKTTSTTSTVRTQSLNTTSVKAFDDGCTYWYADTYFDDVLIDSQYIGSTDCDTGGESLAPPDDGGGDEFPAPPGGTNDGCPTLDVSSASSDVSIIDGDPYVDPSYRSRIYTWKFVTGTTWSWASIEKGVHHFNGTNWEWYSLDHVGDTMIGVQDSLHSTVALFSPAITVGINTAYINMYYQITSTINCGNTSRTDYSGLLPAYHLWNVNDH